MIKKNEIKPVLETNNSQPQIPEVYTNAVMTNMTPYEFEITLGLGSNNYEVIIYWSDEDNAYVAEVPELPGCMSDGSSYEEALGNVRVIIDEWIETAIEEGRVIPEPRGKLMYA